MYLVHFNHFILSVIFICSLLPYPCCAVYKKELVFVNVVWRHGARSSLYDFPLNPNNGKKLWNEEPGQLTQIGMKMQYELGLFMRKRYQNFLSKVYKNTEIYIRSTDVDRTLMSAESNLAGLYPPESYQKWNGSKTSWQPIPVHTVSVDEDHVSVNILIDQFKFHLK